MKRLLAVLSIAAVLGFVASACGSTQTDPATVNGKAAVSSSEFKDALDGFAKSPTFKPQVTGSGSGTVKTDFAASLLTQYINVELMRQEAARRGVTPTQADLDKARPTAGDNTFGSGGNDILKEFPASVQNFFVERIALFDKLDPVLGVTDQAALQKVYEDNKAQFTQVCVRHILVDTEQQAQDVEARLAKGEDFSALAKELSKDTGSGQQGGKLYDDSGCPQANTFVPEFAQAAAAAVPGTPTQPVKSQFGYHIILADKPATVLPFDQVKDQVQKLANGGTSGIDQFLQAQVKSADVKVDPRYGTWKNGLLYPPGAATTTTTPGASSTVAGAGADQGATTTASGS